MKPKKYLIILDTHDCTDEQFNQVKDLITSFQCYYEIHRTIFSFKKFRLASSYIIYPKKKWWVK
jgi:hypothetical protein